MYELLVSFRLLAQHHLPSNKLVELGTNLSHHMQPTRTIAQLVARHHTVQRLCHWHSFQLLLLHHEVVSPSLLSAAPILLGLFVHATLLSTASCNASFLGVHPSECQHTAKTCTHSSTFPLCMDDASFIFFSSVDFPCSLLHNVCRVIFHSYHDRYHEFS